MEAMEDVPDILVRLGDQAVTVGFQHLEEQDQAAAVQTIGQVNREQQTQAAAAAAAMDYPPVCLPDQVEVPEDLLMRS